MLTVFVYGTLKPGEASFQRYCEPSVTQIQTAYCRGQLFHLPQGYPAMTQGDGWVRGALLELSNAAALARIDRFEDYDPTRPDSENLYVRQQRPIVSSQYRPLGTAWVYLMERSQITALGGVIVSSGDWSRQQWPSIAPLEPTFETDC